MKFKNKKKGHRLSKFSEKSKGNTKLNKEQIILIESLSDDNFVSKKVSLNFLILIIHFFL